MKKIGLILLLTSTLLTSNCFITNDLVVRAEVIDFMQEVADYNSVYTASFDNMKEQMNAAPSTGNVNLDFVLEMLPHHKGAINMSKAIIQYGSNDEVKKFAEHIIASQEPEIPKMEELKTEFEKEKASNKEESEAYIKKYDEIKEIMFKGMESVPLTSDADLTFLKQMISHHEGAISMSKNILKYTKNPELIKLATDMVQSQSKDIEEMKQLIKALQK